MGGEVRGWCTGRDTSATSTNNPRVSAVLQGEVLIFLIVQPGDSGDER